MMPPFISSARHFIPRANTGGASYDAYYDAAN
jgi:hypothetical protein